MNPDPDERAQPDGAVPDEFEAIVAGWRHEGTVPDWPADGAPAPGLFEAATPTDVTPTDAGPDERPGDRPGDPTGPGAEPSPPAPQNRSPETAPPPARPPHHDDEHFVPPEPPPLPRIGPPAIVGMALLALGLVLVLSPGTLGVAEPYGLPLGLVGLAAGLGWLVLRLWPDPPSGPDDGPDDGAVL